MTSESKTEEKTAGVFMGKRIRLNPLQVAPNQEANSNCETAELLQHACTLV